MVEGPLDGPGSTPVSWVLLSSSVPLVPFATELGGRVGGSRTYKHLGRDTGSFSLVSMFRREFGESRFVPTCRGTDRRMDHCVPLTTTRDFNIPPRDPELLW